MVNDSLTNLLHPEFVPLTGDTWSIQYKLGRVSYLYHGAPVSAIPPMYHYKHKSSYDRTQQNTKDKDIFDYSPFQFL